MELWQAKDIESRNLRQASKLHPQLFETKNFVDGPDFLEKYGIFLSQKKKFPQGYLKLWPQDFIVEEVGLDGELHNVFPDKFRHREKDFLPEDPVILATLVKCGLSTIEAVEDLARKLKIDPKTIRFAGIKDKHAITSQLISLRGIPAEKLQDISASYFFLKNVFSDRRDVFLGGLRANQFTILVRTGPDFKEKEFSAKIKEIEKNGFYNFYYLQRFGIPRLLNHYCGVHVLNGRYEEAIKTAMCTGGERESLYFRGMRKEIEKLWGNWEEIMNVLEYFPMTFQDERELVGYLIQHPTDFLGALGKIPRVVQLWLTSFAALLFNKVLSSYLKDGENPPSALPLVLDRDPRVWQGYEELLKENGVFSQAFAVENLKPFFPVVILRKRMQNTVERVKIIAHKVIPGGVILNFVLPKGCYATTFLSHLFNLVSGGLPLKFSNLPIDTKANLNQPSLEEILNQFSDVVSSPAWRLLWRIY